MNSTDYKVPVFETPTCIQPNLLGAHRGQFNLFTGEVEPVSELQGLLLDERWLFDPDFRLVLPEDRAGKEILIEKESF